LQGLLIFVIHDLDDFAVVHVCDTIGELENAWIVGDYNECPVGAFRYATQSLHHAAPSLMIQIACRLVAYNQLRVVHQRARDCHALLLATAELRRQRTQARAKIYFD
jgi:hypothetical protein